MAPKDPRRPPGSSGVPEPQATPRAAEEIFLAARQRFDGIEVRDAELEAVDAAGLELIECRLLALTLTEGKLASASLRECVLTGCDLSNTDLMHAQMNSVLIDDSRAVGVVFAESHLRETTIRSTRMDYANLRMAELTNVTFDGTSMREVDLYGAKLRSVRFDGCDLTGADFRGAKLEDVDLRGSKLDALRGLAGLAGATIDAVQAVGLSDAMAAELGIAVASEDPP